MRSFPLVIVVVVVAATSVAARLDVDMECRDCTQLASHAFLIYMSANSSLAQSTCTSKVEEFAADENLILDIRWNPEQCLDIIPYKFKTVSLRRDCQCSNSHESIVNIVKGYLEILIISLVLSVIVIKKSILQKCVFEKCFPPPLNV